MVWYKGIRRQTMVNEKVILKAKSNNGETQQHTLYDCEVSSMDDCFTSESELSWYVLESIANDDLFEDVVALDAESIVTKNGEEVLHLTATIRA